MVMIDVGDPKMAREMLCAIQTQIDVTQMPSGESHIARLEKMIDQLDAHRPLGPDGKHGDLHTATCGCYDVKPKPREHWNVYEVTRPDFTETVVCRDLSSHDMAKRQAGLLYGRAFALGILNLEYTWRKVMP